MAKTKQKIRKVFTNLKSTFLSLGELRIIALMTGKSRKIKEAGKKTMPIYWSISLAWCVFVGLVIPLAGQFFNPLHVLTHEFTQLYTALTGIVLYFLARWAIKKVAQRNKDTSPIDQMRRALFPMLTGIIVMGVTTLAVMYIANVFYWRCIFHRGVPFFGVTWPPVALWAAVGGILVGMRGWGWLKSIGMLLLIIVLSAIQDVLQLLNGARFVDFVLGDPLALNQRVDMSIPEIHFFQRIFVMLLVYSLWHVGLWRFGQSRAAGGSEYLTEVRHIRRKALLSSALLVVLALGLGSHIGLGWGQAALNSELAEVHRTEHFVFRYAPGGNSEDNIEATASGAEWYWHRLSTHWNVSPKKPVEVYVFDGYSHMNRLTGINAPHAVINKIFITYYSAATRTFYHELVHALHQAGFSPKLTVWFNRGIVEGLAEAYEDELVWLPEAHRDRAGALKAGKLPSATDFMSPFGFWKVSEGLAYDSAASFIGFLIYKYGVDTFREFQKSLNYKRVYGKDLPELDTEWKQFLETVPVDVETQIRAGNYFDAAYWGAYSKECCPKLGQQQPDMEIRAIRLWYRGHYDKAFVMYEHLFETTGEVRWGYQAALCLHKQHLFDEALALLDDLSTKENLTDFERIKTLKARTPILMAQHDWPALYAAFDALAAFEEGEPSEDQHIVQSLLHQPEIRAPVAEALLMEDTYKKRQLLEELAKKYPDNLKVQYLYASRAFGSMYIRGGGAAIPPERESQIRAILEYIEKVPDATDKHVITLLDHAVASIQARNYELAEHIGNVLLRHSTNALYRFRAERLLERIDFERVYAKSHEATNKAS